VTSMPVGDFVRSLPLLLRPVLLKVIPMLVQERNTLYRQLPVLAVSRLMMQLLLTT
jgi:hypothetical protein